MDKLLLVEDDHHLGLLVKDHLENAGYDVSWFKDGNEAWLAFDSAEYDLCILDIVLPSLDGLELAKRIKTKAIETPVIFITARSLKSDIVAGFDVGCDDYIVKPFEAFQLLLKIKALLLRVNGFPTSIPKSLSLGGVVLHTSQRLLSYGNSEHKLNRIENVLLTHLLSAKQEVVSRNYMLEHIWGRNDVYTSKSLDTYLYKIRKILKPTTLFLENIYGTGYVLKHKVQKD